MVLHFRVKKLAHPRLPVLSLAKKYSTEEAGIKAGEIHENGRWLIRTALLQHRWLMYHPDKQDGMGTREKDRTWEEIKG